MISAPRPDSRPSTLSRRTLTRGLVWTAPAVALATAAPAFAASTATPSYGFADSGFGAITYTRYRDGAAVESFQFDNVTDVSPGYPQGFSVFNGPDSQDEPSPSVGVTLTQAPVYEVAMPASWFTSTPSEEDILLDPSTPWQITGLRRETVDGVDSFVVALAWVGPVTGTTVPDATTELMEPWPDSQLAFDVDGAVLGGLSDDAAFYWRVTYAFETDNGQSQGQVEEWRRQPVG